MNHSSIQKELLKLAMIAVLFIAFSLTSLPSHKEPVCCGKKLSDWLMDLRADQTEQSRAKAVVAVRAIGTNAVRTLLNRLCYRESSLNQILSKMRVTNRSFETEAIERLDGVHGFEALGPMADSATPKLRSLLWDIELARYAALSLVSIEREKAFPSLTNMLNSGKFEIRSAGTEGLGRLGHNARPAAPSIMRLCKDEHFAVRARAVEAVKAIGPDEVALPLLIESLKDSHEYVRFSAVRVLGNCEAIGMAAKLRLLEACEDSSINVRTAATNALKKAFPESEN